MAARAQATKRRHTPLRSCVACRAKTAKRELLRVVAQPPNAAVAVDASGRLNGRGAYLCQACAAKPQAIPKGRLEHSLRAQIAPERWRELVADIADVAAQSPASQP